MRSKKNLVVSLEDDNQLGKVYRFIVSYKLANDGCAPTMREIGDEIGVGSTSLISYYLDRLVSAGVIKRTGFCSRAICLTGGRYEFQAAGSGAPDGG